MILRYDPTTGRYINAVTGQYMPSSYMPSGSDMFELMPPVVVIQTTTIGYRASLPSIIGPLPSRVNFNVPIQPLRPAPPEPSRHRMPVVSSASRASPASVASRNGILTDVNSIRDLSLEEFLKKLSGG